MFLFGWLVGGDWNNLHRTYDIGDIGNGHATALEVEPLLSHEASG